MGTLHPSLPPVVPVPPAPDVVIVSDGQGLGVPGAAGNINNPVANQGLDKLGLHLIVTVTVPESSVPDIDI